MQYVTTFLIKLLHTQVYTNITKLLHTQYTNRDIKRNEDVHKYHKQIQAKTYYKKNNQEKTLVAALEAIFLDLK